MEAIILFSILIVTIALSIPIGITLGLSTCIAMLMTSDIPMIMLAQKSVTGLDSFPLLAIPFFILAGALMCNGGISRRLVALAESLVGYIVGGLAMVTVLACMFFAAISGSGPATVSAIGSFMIPSMTKEVRCRFCRGYYSCCRHDRSHNTSEHSIRDLLHAAVFDRRHVHCRHHPCIIIGIALMLVCYITARKRNTKP